MLRHQDATGMNQPGLEVRKLQTIIDTGVVIIAEIKSLKVRAPCKMTYIYAHTDEWTGMTEH